MLPSTPQLLWFPLKPKVVAAGGNVAFGWRNNSDVVNVNSGTSFTVGTTNAAFTNGSIAQNDLLVMIVNVSTNATTAGVLVPPGGWTQVLNDQNTTQTLSVGVWYKLAGAAEPGTYSVSWTNTARGASWALLDYTSVNLSTPVETSASIDNNGFSANLGCPTVTPTASDDLLIAIATEFGGQNSYTTPSGMTLRVNNASTSSDKPGLGVADLQLVSNSATGTKNFTIAGSSQSICTSLAVKHA